MSVAREQIYGILERGIYRTFRYPRGKNTPAGVPGGIVNDHGFMPNHGNFFTLANVSARVLEQDARLKFLQIQNMSLANDIIYAFGKQASLNDGITLTPGQVEIFDVAVPVEFLEIFCVASLQRVHIVTGH